MKYLLLILAISTCRGDAAKKDEARKTKFINLQEPFLNSVPDSMKKYIAYFDTVYLDDQKYRSYLDPYLMRKHPEQKKLDSINLIKIKSFLNKYGYPSCFFVGIKVQTTINLVIQHAPVAFQEEMLPYVAKAFFEGKVPGGPLAMLEDRINYYKKRPQYYGTQIMALGKDLKVYPLRNLDSVNLYRKQIGFYQTLEEYIMAFFKMKFSVEDYKSYEPALIKTYNVQMDSQSVHIPIPINQ
ncbi:MAG: hypothetical protein QM737_11465 [Ferruginibacter sp.]